MTAIDYSVCVKCGMADDPRRTTCLSCGAQMVPATTRPSTPARSSINENPPEPRGPYSFSRTAEARNGEFVVTWRLNGEPFFADTYPDKEGADAMGRRLTDEFNKAWLASREQVLGEMRPVVEAAAEAQELAIAGLVLDSASEKDDTLGNIANALAAALDSLGGRGE